MRVALILCGMYIIVEAILSLLWTKNDKWFWSQMVRVSRIIAGVFIIWASYYVSV